MNPLWLLALAGGGYYLYSEKKKKTRDIGATISRDCSAVTITNGLKFAQWEAKNMAVAWQRTQSGEITAGDYLGSTMRVAFRRCDYEIATGRLVEFRFPNLAVLTWDQLVAAIADKARGGLDGAPAPSSPIAGTE